MNKLDMCRICLAEDLRLQVVINTHLQEIFQSLSLLPFVTQDNRPLQACVFCCAKLQKCYELRKNILHSEQLFTQMLCTDVLVPPELGGIFHKNRLKITPVVDLSLGIEYSKKDKEVKESSQEMNVTTMNVEVPEVFEYDPLGNDSLEEQLCLDIVKKEKDDNKASEEPPDASPLPKDVKPSYIHTEDGISEECSLSDIKIEVSSNTPTLQTEPEDSTNNFEELNQTATSRDDLDLLIVKKEVELAETSAISNNKSGQVIQKIPDTTSSIKKNKRKTSVTDVAQRKSIKTSESKKIITKTKKYESDKASSGKSSEVKKKVKIKKCSVQTVNGEQQYRCKACKKWYNSRSTLQKHMLTHTDERPYKCNLCEKKFILKTHLDNHNRIHSGIKPHKCTICEKRFFQKAHLDVHNRIHTGEKPYHCNVCDKSFTVKSHLNTHFRRNHSNERPFQCDVCKKGFKDTSGLHAHVIIHTGKKPYQCKICLKDFNSHGNLSKHARTHTKEKPYECDVCNKSFAQKVQLGNHIRIHTGEKPYECSVCDKRFITNSHLVTHMRTHTGEKPYQCNICEKCFRRRAELRKHVQKHTNEVSN